MLIENLVDHTSVSSRVVIAPPIRFSMSINNRRMLGCSSNLHFGRFLMKLSNESVVVELKNSTVVQAPLLSGLRTFDSVKQRTLAALGTGGRRGVA